MISELQSSRLLYWQQLLKFGEQLVNLTSVAAQKDLVTATASQLVGGTVSLWLSSGAYPLPGSIENLTIGPPSGKLAQMALETRQTQYEPNAPDAINIVFAVATPLIAQDTLIGVLQVIRPADQPFEPVELDLMQAFTSVAAANMHAYRQVTLKNWRFEQLALVRSVSFQIANVLDMDELARRVTRLILQTFKYYYVAIYTHEPGQNKLTLRASSKYSAQTPSLVEVNQGFSVDIGQGIVGFVAQSGEEMVACRVEEEPRFRYIETLPETRSECAFPLKISERVLGVLDVQSDQPEAFHEIDILVMHALADNIALAVEGANLYNNVHRRADQIAAVAAIGRAMTSILDIEALLKQVVELIHDRLGYPYVHLFLIQQDEDRIAFKAGSGEISAAMQIAAISYSLNDPHGIIPWVARNNQAFLSNDVSQDNLYRPNPLAPSGTCAELTLPLTFGDHILGVLDLQSNLANAFFAHDLPTFQALADSVAIAIHNANAYREEQWRRQVAESLQNVAFLLSANAGFDKVLESVLDELQKNLPCELAAIWLFRNPDDPKEITESLSLAAIHSTDPGNLDFVKSIDPKTDSTLEKALAADQPLIRNPEDSLGSLGFSLNYSQDYSLLATSLRAADQVLGIIALAHPKCCAYNSDSQSMIATFASYAAVAIQNARLYASAQEQAWISTVLLQVAEATQSLTTIDDLIASVVRLTPLLVGVKGCAFYLWNANDQVFEAKAAHGLANDQDPGFLHKLIPVGTPSAFDRLYTTRQPVVVIDPAVDLRVSAELIDDLELNALVLIPLQVQSDLLGAILISLEKLPYIDEEDNPEDDERLAIIQGIAQQTAVAMQNIHLLEGKQEEAYVTAVLLEVAQAVVSNNYIGDILDSIVEIMPILVGIDSSVIYLLDKDRKVFYAAHACCGPNEFDTAFFDQVYSPGSFPLLDAVWSKDNPVIYPLPDTSISPFYWNTVFITANQTDPDEFINQKTGLLMGFPLSSKGEQFGVFIAADLSSNSKPRPRRLEILSGIAQQASMAIQNDRLQNEIVGRERLEREFQLARQIQRTFLPTHIPEVCGWDIDVRWRTARQVGGDFYDFIELPGDRWGLVIADVSDKGIAAALYMTVTRTLIRASGREIESPARVLEHVNDLLLNNSQDGLFVTAFYAILDPASGDFIYANAGHNLPLIFNSNDQTISCLIQGGSALGALGSITLEDHHYVINPEDCLVMYTDGATETFSPTGEQYGDQRLVQAFQSSRIISAQSILDDIENDINNFRLDEPVSDDITLLVIKRLLQ